MPRLRAAIVCALLVPAPALAWTEAEPIEAELRVAVDPAGNLVGTYRVTISIDAGRFHGFDLDGLPDGFTADPLATTAEDAQGNPLAVELERWVSGRVHVALSGVRGEGRGRVVFQIAFHAHAAVSVDEDEKAVVTVSTPPWDHGMNRTLVAIELPAPPGDVEIVDADLFDGATVEDLGGSARVTTLRHRLPRWTPMSVSVRLPPARMQSAIAEPAPRPAPRPRAHRIAPPRRARSPLTPWALAAIPAILALAKAWESRRTSRRAGCATAPFVGKERPVLRSLALALASAGGALALEDHRITLGVGLWLAAGFIGARRFVRLPEPPPPPGRWVRVEIDELRAAVRGARARRRATTRWLDPTNLAGFCVTATLAAGAAIAVRAVLPLGLGPALSLAAAIASVLVVPLGTALGPTIPPPRTAREGRLLLAILPSVEAILAAEGGGGVGPVARLPQGADRPDILRLRIGPSIAPAGLRCIEIGVEHYGEHAGIAALVRVLPGSAAEAVVTARRWAIVESPDQSERVGIHRAELGGARAVLAEVRRLAGALRAYQMQSAPDGPSAVHVMPSGHPSGVPSLARSQSKPQFVAVAPSSVKTHAPLAGARSGHPSPGEHLGAQKPDPDPSASMQSESKPQSSS